MQLRLPLRPGHLVLVAGVITSALCSAFACTSGSTDPHQGDRAKRGDCVSCHLSAYRVATNPLHLNVMPPTCRDCHATTSWSPANSTGHPWWPLQNKHATTPCTACHDKGFRPGDTPTDCQGCHRKDYDGATKPSHVGYPLDCAMCHSDAGFKPSTYKHRWPLEGQHVIVPCTSCHTGTPPKFEGTSTDCYGCHKAAADASTFPDHASFPHTCLDCHVMSGWRPAVSGLHPEAKFPRATGKHAAPGIGCQDCHVLAKGVSAGGQNTDCVDCHLGSHVRPAIDARHLQLNVPNYPTGNATTNFCLSCHPAGTK